jgi:hypothetical protein
LNLTKITCSKVQYQIIRIFEFFIWHLSDQDILFLKKLATENKK